MNFKTVLCGKKKPPFVPIVQCLYVFPYSVFDTGINHCSCNFPAVVPALVVSTCIELHERIQIFWFVKEKFFKKGLLMGSLLSAENISEEIQLKTAWYRSFSHPQFISTTLFSKHLNFLGFPPQLVIPRDMIITVNHVHTWSFFFLLPEYPSISKTIRATMQISYVS